MAQASRRPNILLISLNKDAAFEDRYVEVLGDLEVRANVVEATTSKDALEHLCEVTAWRIQAVIFTDPTIVIAKDRLIIDAIFEYARNGGTVVFGFDFAFRACPEDMESFWCNEWDAPEEWKVTEEMTTDVLFNENSFPRWHHHAEMWEDQEDPESRWYRVGDVWIDPVCYDVSGVYLINVDETSSVFGSSIIVEVERDNDDSSDKTSDTDSDTCTKISSASCIVFRSLEKGWYGYIGIRGCSSSVYIIMCDLHNKAMADSRQETEWAKVSHEKDTENARYLRQAEVNAAQRAVVEEALSYCEAVTSVDYVSDAPSWIWDSGTDSNATEEFDEQSEGSEASQEVYDTQPLDEVDAQTNDGQESLCYKRKHGEAVDDGPARKIHKTGAGVTWPQLIPVSNRPRVGSDVDPLAADLAGLNLLCSAALALDRAQSTTDRPETDL